ncbi:MAG: hypothetical protein H0W83_14985 [Planctomycetes bacterium]|nr:hypothetical protein [Planctomycetota bacterium]
MPTVANPFAATDADRRAIWDILMLRDLTAFIANDWKQTAGDFVPNKEFVGIDAGKQADPAQWKLTYPSLAIYREEWLRQAAAFSKTELVGTDKATFLFGAITLARIDITGARALADKVFAGSAKAADGSAVELRWRTLYHLRRSSDGWKIAGFIGYLPEPAR